MIIGNWWGILEGGRQQSHLVRRLFTEINNRRQDCREERKWTKKKIRYADRLNDGAKLKRTYRRSAATDSMEREQFS